MPPAFIYFDYACPWSYLVFGRIERLTAELPVRAVWRPLELAAGATARRDAPAGGEGPERVAAAAAELGLPFRPLDRVVRTRDALQAAEFARDLGAGAFERLHRALFHARFGRGVDLGDRAALLGVVAECGIDPDAVAAALEDGRYDAELRAAEEEAARYGIDATPTLLIGRFKLVGAAPLATLRETWRRAAADDPYPGRGGR